ncbi:MAG: amino acid permease [Gammaproteobacteria bacterium]|nr:amino acid permease [Gammaproteobacteria bacterium]
MGRQSKFSAATAAAVVVANMIGTGVFTSLGFQLLDIQSGFVLLMLWAVGGLAALCGALCYAELGAALPRSGGEYHFLSEIYHPAVGFVAGWISATIGFAAPTALAAITFGAYLGSALPMAPPEASATVLVIGLTAAHMSTRRGSGGVQRWFTGLKVALILGFCAAVWVAVDGGQPIVFTPVPGDGGLLLGSAFAVALIYVNYAYTGWNAATYLTSEVADPQRNLPRALALGTALVAGLYLLLNFTFLHAAPIDAMAGQLEIGAIVAEEAFGGVGGKMMGLVLAALLISTVSALTLAGPRVMQVIGEDFPAFRALARTNRDGLPTVAIATQSLMALAFIWTASFESILVFAGFALGLSTFITVAGVFVLRWRRPGLARPYRITGYPLPPLAYLGITGWTLFYILAERPQEAGLSLALILAGAAFHWLSNRAKKPARRGFQDGRQQGEEHGGVG